MPKSSWFYTSLNIKRFDIKLEPVWVLSKHFFVIEKLIQNYKVYLRF